MCVYPHVKQFLPAQELMSISKLMVHVFSVRAPKIDDTVHFNIVCKLYITGEAQIVLGV